MIYILFVCDYFIDTTHDKYINNANLHRIMDFKPNMMYSIARGDDIFYYLCLEKTAGGLGAVRTKSVQNHGKLGKSAVDVKGFSFNSAKNRFSDIEIAGGVTQIGKANYNLGYLTVEFEGHPAIVSLSDLAEKYILPKKEEY